MNIKDYILANNLPHKMIGNVMYQTEDLDLSDKGITSLNGFVQNGYLDLSYNQITSLNGFVQNGILYLSYNQITSLNGFVQNGYLDLSYNQITSLNGFVQNGYLNLSYNQITSLNGFVQNGYLDLRFNLIKNTKNVFTNPKTKRVVIYNPKLKTYSCGCFYQKSEQEFIEKCRDRGFTEVLEHFNLTFY